MQGEFPVSGRGLNDAFEFIAAKIKSAGQDEGNAHRLSVILDELCANMIRHDDTLDETTCFRLELLIDGSQTTMVVSDPGEPFDPLAFQHDEMPEIGGHGISLVKGLSSAVSYRRAGNRNELRITVTSDT